jgi:hypothetical protein
MLLMMEAWGRTFLHGDSPYGLVNIAGEQTQCCYFPGLWLSFLPAVVFNIDPRFLETFYTLIFAGMVWLSMRPQDRPLGSWFLVLFLLNPWALSRQEVYFSAYLLFWAVFYWSLCLNRWRAAAGWYGLGLSAHPFSWVLLPVWVAWNVRGRGWKAAGQELLQALGVGALIIFPFLIWDPRGFFEGTVVHWAGNQNFAVSHFGLAVWMTHWPGLLRILALIFLGLAVWAVGRGRGSLDSLFRWLALLMGLELLISYHIEHYYYFVPLAFVFFHEIALLRRDGDEIRQLEMLLNLRKEIKSDLNAGIR